MSGKSLVISFLSVVAVCTASYLFLDIPALRFLSERYQTLNYIFEKITHLGISIYYLVLSASAFLFFKYVRSKPDLSNSALFVFVSIASSGILNSIFKFIFGRYRPGAFLENHLYGFSFFATGYDQVSFPSGHANTITALVLSLYLLSRRRKLLHVLVALPIAMSRVIIGSHYLSDVIFGSYLAVVMTLSVKNLFDKKGINLGHVLTDKVPNL